MGLCLLRPFTKKVHRSAAPNVFRFAATAPECTAASAESLRPNRRGCVQTAPPSSCRKLSDHCLRVGLTPTHSAMGATSRAAPGGWFAGASLACETFAESLHEVAEVLLPVLPSPTALWPAPCPRQHPPQEKGGHTGNPEVISEPPKESEEQFVVTQNRVPKASIGAAQPFGGLFFPAVPMWSGTAKAQVHNGGGQQHKRLLSRHV